MEIKSGIKSSEFYVTLLPGVVSLLVVAGVIDPIDSDVVLELTTQIIAGIVALATFVTYIAKRTELKKEVVRSQSIPASEPLHKEVLQEKAKEQEEPVLG